MNAWPPRQRGLKSPSALRTHATQTSYWALTFVSVVGAWVLFRAQTFEGAARILGAMAHFDRIAVPPQLAGVLPESLAAVLHPSATWVVSLRNPVDGILRVGGLLLIALAMPNAHTMLSHHGPAIGIAPSQTLLARVFAGFNWRTGVLAGFALGAALTLMTEDEFLYFNF